MYLSKIQSSIQLAYCYSIKKGGSLKPSLSTLVVYQSICLETTNPTISMAKVILVLDLKSSEHEELAQTQTQIYKAYFSVFYMYVLHVSIKYGTKKQGPNILIFALQRLPHTLASFCPLVVCICCTLKHQLVGENILSTDDQGIENKLTYIADTIRLLYQ